ncbi:hypothetical protein Scep_011113 [Stephania cephalantha]|uniref:Uncharacterized protein n=1 Tax=Stephania cephalantha TaxID=152367 RepID=A0AAP0JDK1_9MAGN
MKECPLLMSLCSFDARRPHSTVDHSTLQQISKQQKWVLVTNSALEHQERKIERDQQLFVPSRRSAL